MEGSALKTYTADEILESFILVYLNSNQQQAIQEREKLENIIYHYLLYKYPEFKKQMLS